MPRQIVATADAPAAIGPYSQAVRVGDTVWLSGQIPLDPATGQLVEGDFTAQVERAFANLAAVVKAAGGTLDQVVKLTLFLTDLGQFGTVNEIMQRHFRAPYPARSTVGVASLPRGAQFEVEAVLVLEQVV
ncbi:MAG: reactive intermediate/imine deaminase [Lautropia sp. SCN 70-15]|jgi:reactive intermediate/imine deaminase|nr:MAG: reactive intermediate/imine deaminase [Lautropia sp. SCN 70-15]